jgi:hypothetical protein
MFSAPELCELLKADVDADFVCGEMKAKVHLATQFLKNQPGREKEEEEMLKKLLEFPMVDDDAILVMQQLSKVYCKPETFDQKCALQWSLDTMEFAKSALGFGHPEIATATALVAEAYANNGELDIAFELYLEVLQFRNRFLPSDHPDLDATIVRIHELLADHPDFENIHLKYVGTLAYQDLPEQLRIFKQMVRAPVLGTYPSNRELYEQSQEEQELATTIYERKCTKPYIPNIPGDELQDSMPLAKDYSLDKNNTFIFNGNNYELCLCVIKGALGMVVVDPVDPVSGGACNTFEQNYVKGNVVIFDRDEFYCIRFAFWDPKGEINSEIVGGVRIYKHEKEENLVFEFFITSGEKLLFGQIVRHTISYLQKREFIKGLYNVNAY